MSKRSRVLFVAEEVTLAHVTRPLVLARSLDPARYEIHFAGANRFPHVFRDEPFKQWKLDSITPEQFLRALAKGSPLYDYRTLSRYMSDDIDLIRRLSPDLIVGDFRLSLSVSASLVGVPYATITNAYWSPYARAKYPLPDLPMVPFLGVTLSELLFRAVRPAAFAYHAWPLNRLRRKYGLAPLADIRHTYTGADYTLYADCPGLVPTCNLPANHHYLGPIFWSPHSVKPAWWDELPEDRPTVYVNLGSSGRVALLSSIFRALGQLQVNILVATAGRVAASSLPDGVWCADYLPGEEAAARSVLVICNGGSPTVYQSLNQGVPVLGLPTNLDQYLNMGYVQDAGAGIWLRSDRAREKGICNAVRTLLASDSYQRAARLQAAEFQKYNAVARFGDLLHQWVG